ncbi:uncharacterized protein METZ01_LOCUS274370 [marine metagenome]|uniref:Uncharacterized protein n=1 Tax=marine metagenome TaxID=408172 RepID=A0A382KBZ0_9ZZZZ
MFQSNGSGTLSNVNSGLKGAGPVLITTSDASQVTTIDFTSGIDSTYDKYMFVILGWNPNDNNYAAHFNGATDGPSSPTYAVTKTSVAFETGHGENNVTAGPVIYAGQSLAQSTGFQQINNGPGNDADQCLAGIMYLYTPSSTANVKHYTITSNVYGGTDYSYVVYQAGYFNTTDAINAIRFQGYSGGAFDAKIKMYGCT